MKLTAAPNHLSDAIAPLMTLNYLAGLRIFEYPRGTPRTVSSVVYILILISIFGVALQLQSQFYENVTLLKLEYVLYELMTYVNVFIIMYEIILGCFYSKKLDTCYKKLAQIDETLRQLGSMFNYGGLYLFIISGITLWFLYIAIVCIISIINLPANLYVMICLLISQSYSVSISFIVIFEFSIFVKCLQTRFELINELLSEGAAVSSMEGLKMGLFSTEDYAQIADVKQRKHILSLKVLSQLNRQLQTRIRTSLSRKRKLSRSQTRSRIPSPLQKQFQMELQGQSRNQTGDSTNSTRRVVVNLGCKKRKHLLQTIRQVHLELCRVTKMLCTSFGIQITSEIGMSIMFVTAVFYNLYIRWFQQQQNISFNTAMDNAYVLMLGIMYVAKVIIINRVCKNATSEIQQFGLQISHSPVEIVTFSIPLNYQVLGAYLKTVSTYMVIMIQMSNSLEDAKHLINEK